MKILYLDNFRGFTDTFIPIVDVNFLVGENSTGKTSVLGLLELFSSHRFWISQDFDTEDIRFGHFNDIVSIHSESRKSFSIGMIEPGRGRGEDRSEPWGFLMTFVEKEGVPSLSRYTFSKGAQVTNLKFMLKKVQYQELAIEVPENPDKFQKSVFPSWVSEHRNSSGGYSTLNVPDDFPVRTEIPLIWVLSMLRQNHSGKEKKNSSLQFYLPGPSFGPAGIVWLAPIRTKPRRTYDEVSLEYSSDGRHTPYLIRKILGTKKLAEDFLSLMRKVGQDSGLFESVEIRRYGKGATAPFEVDIVLDGKPLNLSTVGYGVSQSLPVIVELLIREKGTWYAIQQPEVHLHPKAQAALGDLIFDLARRENKHFLVETHSDFTIDRFRRNYRKKSIAKVESQVVFFQRKNHKNTITAILIDKKGDLSSSQPRGYREFFVKEEMKNLGL